MNGTDDMTTTRYADIRDLDTLLADPITPEERTAVAILLAGATRAELLGCGTKVTDGDHLSGSCTADDAALVLVRKGWTLATMNWAGW